MFLPEFEMVAYLAVDLVFDKSGLCKMLAPVVSWNYSSGRFR
jgi:hypothetical protein